jgi:integrase
VRVYVAADRLSVRTLERLYGELRRCRVRCDGRPFVEHRSDDVEHDAPTPCTRGSAS